MNGSGDDNAVQGEQMTNQARGERGRIRMRHVVWMLVLVLLVGAGAYAAVEQPWRSPESAPPAPEAVRVPPKVVPGIDASPVASPPPVLAGLPRTQQPTGREVARRLAPLMRARSLGSRTGIRVTDLESGEVVWTSGPQNLTPASTTKIVTSLTALDALGADRRFATTAVQGRNPRQVVLVGGGDPLLTDVADGTYPRQATLASLARQTAASLRGRNVRRVRLTYDATLFTGPAISPGWRRSYVPDDVVSRISALWVDAGRAPGQAYVRSDDPADAAATRFAELLESRGITVTGTVAPGGAPQRTPQTDPGPELGRVESPPVAQLVQHLLEESDNETSEVLLRQAALASGRPGSFDGGTATARAVLAQHQIDTRGLVLFDGSGLSRRNRIPLGVLTSAMRAGAGDAALGPVMTGLPIAGWTGSLDGQFLYTGTAGLGRVRAKTGTLTGVHALAGVVQTRDGRMLAFAVATNNVRPNNEWRAPVQLTRIAGALATV